MQFPASLTSAQNEYPPLDVTPLWGGSDDLVGAQARHVPVEANQENEN